MMPNTFEILDQLIGFDTVSSKSNLDMIEFVEAFLLELGFRVCRIKGATPNKAGLFAEIGSGNGGIMLSGHTDVVPVEGQRWTLDPFRMTESEGRVFGRGTTDMKGYLACMLSAAERASSQKLNEPLKLVFSYDEEIGCVGIQQMATELEPLLGRPRLCVVGEPTDMEVAIGHKGKAALKAVCLGQSGHSALAPKFVNALHLASDFVSELRSVQDTLRTQGAQDNAYDIPYSTVHVGKLSGGTALNIVPDRAELVFEFRHLAEDSPQKIMTLIEEAAERVSAHYRRDFAGAAVVLESNNTYPGLSVAEDSDAVALARRFACSEQTTKVAFGTEAGVFADLGIPTIVCGPGSMEAQGHKPDEFITLEQLAACEGMMDRMLEEITA